MTWFSLRCRLFVAAALLLSVGFVPAAHADGPALSAVFGIAGHYQPGGWTLVKVTVRNPGPDTISGQLQVRAADDSGRSPYGRPARAELSSEVFACPVTVPGGGPQTFPIYLHGIDPGQADLTIQLTEGRERSDGRVLAQINTQDPNTATAFTGGPVGTNDHLLVGFGGDPGAFLFLNGQRWGPANIGNSNLPTSGMPATLQVSEAASASDLPDKAAGYDGVDSFLLRSDAPIDGLTQAQGDALKGWIASGGHLIVCGNADPTRFSTAFFEGLLPAIIGSAPSSGALTLSPKPLPGVRVIASSASGAPSAVIGPYGAGSVTITADNSKSPAVWQTLLSNCPDSTASVLGMAASEDNTNMPYYYSGAPPHLFEAVMRGPSLDAPGTPVIGAFLLIYLIILVPANYLVLKRLDRKEWAWMTIPVIVILFAAGTFAVGYAAKGGNVFLNRAAIIETRAGQQEAGEYAALGLFSPRRTSYDLTLDGPNLTAAIPNSGGSGYGGRNAQTYEPAQFLQTSSGVTLHDAAVNMWAMRAFSTRSTTDLGGAIDGSLADKNGQLTGSLVNHSAYPLTDCAVLYLGRWAMLGAFASGASVTVPAGGPSTNSLPGQVWHDTANSDIHDRMQGALADYYRSLGQSRPNFYGGYPTPIYSPAAGEALLIGWSRDPRLAGPAPQVDGHAVTENDVSLVIVHVPVSGAAAPVVRAAFLPPPSSSGLGSFVVSPIPFARITQSSLEFRQAVDTQRLGTAAKRVGRVIRIRGIVSCVSSSPSAPGVVLDFEPDVSQQGVTASLAFTSNSHDPGIQAVLGKEVVVTGVLSRSQGAPQIVVTRPAQVQIVQ